MDVKRVTVPSELVGVGHVASGEVVRRVEGTELGCVAQAFRAAFLPFADVTGVGSDASTGSSLLRTVDP